MTRKYKIKMTKKDSQVYVRAYNRYVKAMAKLKQVSEAEVKRLGMLRTNQPFQIYDANKYRRLEIGEVVKRTDLSALKNETHANLYPVNFWNLKVFEDSGCYFYRKIGK